MRSTRPAILFLTHIWNQTVADRFARLQSEAFEFGDVVLLLQIDSLLIEGHPPLPEALHPFELAPLPERLGIPYLLPDALVPGCAHYPVMDFALSQNRPHVWVIEHDVEFSGSWSRLFSATSTSSADCLVSHLHPHAQRPDWYWWSNLRAPHPVRLQPHHAWRAFFPIYRISLRALRHLYHHHRMGWSGHMEGLVPTVLKWTGMDIQDLQSVVDCYLPGDQDPDRPPLSSLRWRPEIHEETLQSARPDTIYHPVKIPWTFGPSTH